MSKEKILLGFRRFTSKKNNIPCCIATVATKFDVNDNQRGSFGMSAEDIFLPQELYSYLSIDDIGKPVTVIYDIVSGRAYINNFVVDRTSDTGKK